MPWRQIQLKHSLSHCSGKRSLLLLITKLHNNLNSSLFKICLSKLSTLWASQKKGIHSNTAPASQTDTCNRDDNSQTASSKTVKPVNITADAIPITSKTKQLSPFNAYTLTCVSCSIQHQQNFTLTNQMGIQCFCEINFTGMEREGLVVKTYRQPKPQHSVSLSDKCLATQWEQWVGLE